MGVPGRTGVKGVIRDRDEQAQINKEKHAQRIDDLNRHMEKTALVGNKSYLDEERERALGVLLRGGDLKEEKIDALVLGDMEKNAAASDVFGRERQEGRFGHLREIGVKGYLNAVEKEDPDVWVIVHLYEPFVERCYTLDEELAQLARQYPFTKFIRCRASVLGFASSPSTSSRRRPAPSSGTLSRSSRPNLFAGRIDEDDEDDDATYGSLNNTGSGSLHRRRTDEDDEDVDSEEDADAEDDDVDVDTDMLPTMLVYRNSELVFNWVRVDWEAGQDGVQELLVRHHVIPRSPYTDAGDEQGDDKEVDLRWSDENY
jgi:hypothetical protein